jgi:hypothetical protein
VDEAQSDSLLTDNLSFLTSDLSVSLEHKSCPLFGLVGFDFCKQFFVSNGFVVDTAVLKRVIVLPVACPLCGALCLLLHIVSVGKEVGPVFDLFGPDFGVGFVPSLIKEFKTPFLLEDTRFVFCFGFCFFSKTCRGVFPDGL